jgi:hypothetical protein
MSPRTTAARWAFTVAVAAMVTLTAGCAPEPLAQPDPTASVPQYLPVDLSPERVLAAAVLLAAGDIDKAVAAGVVTPAEVDAATASIAAGTLGLWRERLGERPQ